MHFGRFCILLVLLPTWAFGQPKKFFYKDTLKTAAATVGIQFSHMKSPQQFPIWEKDTIDAGTDGAVGKTVVAYLGKDSIQIRNDNFPYEEKHYFPLQLAGKHYTLVLRFNNVRAYYSPEYIRANRKRAFVEIPETFELANILLMLSPAGRKAGNMVQNGRYHDEVITYFKPHLDHPVFSVLDVPEAQYSTNYFEFRDNSVCYRFSGDRLVPTQYFFVYGSDDSSYTNAFRNNIGLIEDFAKKSGFREFYQKHLPYYQQQIALQTEWSDVAGMQKWLEKEFTRPKIDCSKLFFSPIIGSSHSTQRFSGFGDGGSRFQERLLFVRGPDIYISEKGWNDQQRRGALAGMIFTEVDHNYVNPRTDDFRSQIDSIFSNREIWARGKHADFYRRSVFVFNEYMTHALFSLYALDTFDEPTARFLIERREAMNEGRGFLKFREFNAALMELKKETPNTPVSELYPKIIGWCRSSAKR